MQSGANPVEHWVTASPAPVTSVPKHDRIELSAVFVTYGTGAIVIDAISSLAASLDETPFEVVVVDNEHPDRPDRTFRRLIADTTGVRVVRPWRNLGFGGGCDLGVACASGTLVALLNPDVMLTPGWLEPLRAALDRGAAIAAPVLVEPDGSTQSAGHRLGPDASTAPVTDAPPPGAVSSPDYASAACWLLTRSTYLDLGGFDEAFHPAYYEDVDFALRARPLGGTAVVGDVRIVHLRGQSTSTSVEPDTTAQRLRLLAKWPELAERATR